MAKQKKLCNKAKNTNIGKSWCQTVFELPIRECRIQEIFILRIPTDPRGYAESWIESEVVEKT